MKYKFNGIINLIYLMIIFVILGGILGILDFRLGLSDRFSLINDFFSIIFIICTLKNVIKNGITIYEEIKRIQVIGSLLIGILLLNCVISVAINNEINSSILAIKNLIIPICILILGILNLNKIKNINVNVIICIINFFAIINIILVFLGFTLGWEKITNYVLGESLYAFHIYSFGNSGSLLRVPGLFVDALTQGSFSFLVFISNFIYIISNKQKKVRYNIIFLIIGLIGVLLSTNRQIILGTIISMVTLFIIKNKKASILIVISSILSANIVMFFVLNSNKDIFSMESLMIRINVWKGIILDMGIGENFLKLFFGTGVDATTLGKGNFGIELVDNAYLLMLHDYGLIGLIIFILLLISLAKFFLKNFKNDFAKISFLYLIYFVVRMFFHSSIVNEYDSNMFYIIELVGISSVFYKKEYVNLIE